MRDQGRGEVVDHHEFDVWRYENDTIDINCRRDECEVDVHTAYMEAMVIARTLGEDLNEATEVCSVKVYDNGLSSTSYYRKDSVQTWTRFRWLKERLHSGGYAGVIAQPKPPEWLMLPLWALEYFVALNMLQWALLTGRMRAVDYMETTVPSCPGSSEAPPAPELGANVVPFPGRPRANT